MKAKQNLWTALGGLVASAPLLGQPTITTHPVDQSVSLNATVQFRVTARSSGGALTYRWWFKDAAMDPALNPSAAKSTLNLSNVTEVVAGSYWATVSDDNGSATSEIVQLEVDPSFVKVTTGDVVNDKIGSLQGAWGDYDGDGALDLAVVGGYWDTSGGITGRLYHNDGQGKLVLVSSGLLSASRDRNDYLAWADADNDGDLDLAVGVHESATAALYFNRGNGEFEKVRTTAAWIANRVEVRGAVVAWGDYDADGWVDLMLPCWAAQAGDTRADALLRNLTGGRFEAVKDSALALTGTSEETVSWVDYEGDGDLDLFSVESAAPWGEMRLFRNLGRGRFEPVTDSLLWGDPGEWIYHNSVWVDYDNDEDLDVLVTTTRQDWLYRNERDGQFTRVDPAEIGLELSRMNNWNGPAWGDYDNDGYLDLFCTDNQDRNRLYHNRADGTFEEFLAGSVGNETADGVLGAWGDYDDDGYLDLFVANDNGKNDFLYRNNHGELLAGRGRTNGWLRLGLQGTASNRSGVGAEVFVGATLNGKPVRQMRQIGGQTCAPELFAHFGLGDAAQADVIRVEWPSGIVQELANVPANRILTITEPPRLQALGAGRVRIQCWKGQSFEAEVSNDLATWTSLGVFTNETGTLEFTDPGAAGPPYRFYRAASQ